MFFAAPVTSATLPSSRAAHAVAGVIVTFTASGVSECGDSEIELLELEGVCQKRPETRLRGGSRRQRLRRTSGGSPSSRRS